MIASLPMYWRAETAELWQEFWREVQGHANRSGLFLPDLTAPENLPRDWIDHWTDASLALSMTCSLPFRTALRDKVHYVGTLGFGLPGPNGHYYSRALINKDLWDQRRTQQLGPLRLAYNSGDSQSGWMVSQLRGSFSQPLRFHDYLETGSHLASFQAVAEGRADVAFVDAVPWRMIKRYDGHTERVHVWGKSDHTPGLPLITALGNDPAPIRKALLAAVLSYAPDDKWAIGGPLSFHVLDENAYLSQPIPTPPPGH